METFWFIAVLFVLAMYIVLDGFDFGAGMIYLYVARTDVERRLILNAIGPVWNGLGLSPPVAGSLVSDEMEVVLVDHLVQRAISIHCQHRWVDDGRARAPAVACVRVVSDR